MKILIIHNKYGKYSGEEAVVDSQINLLKANGHKVITYFRSSKKINEMYQGKVKAFFAAFYNPKSVKEVKFILNKEKPDIVHIHNLYPFISPSILPIIKKEEIPIVMTVHNYRLLCPNGLFFTNGSVCEKCTKKGKELNCIINNCEQSLIKSSGYALRNYWSRVNKFYIENVDIFLSLTNFQKEKLIVNGYPPERICVLPNYYDKEIISKEYDFTKRNYVAYAGRISPEKGIPILLKAAKRLPEITFKLAGGAREGYLERLEIPRNVILEGMLSSEDLSNFYQNARFLVISSICYEGFPMILPESMAHKLPVIVPRFAGFPEIIEHKKNGLLFESNDANSLADNIEKLWMSKELAKTLSTNGFLKLKQEYTKEVYFNRIINIYNKLIKNQNN